MHYKDLTAFAKPDTRHTVAYFLQFHDQHLNFAFKLSGRLEDLYIPPNKASFAKGNKLYEHTCFEIFLAKVDGSYVEWNFSPSSAWSQYSFQSYRERQGQADISQPPKFDIRKVGDELIILGKLNPVGFSLVGVSAVIEDENGLLTYWAVKHGKDKPDFHDAKSFLKLSSIK